MFDEIPAEAWKRLLWFDPERLPRIGTRVLVLDARKGACIGIYRGRRLIEVLFGNIPVEAERLPKRCRDRYQAAISR